MAMHRRRNKKIKHKEELALQGIAAGIGDRLHAAHPGSKWKWVCYPVGFAISGGIARIEILYDSGETQFMDVCVSAKGYMALHVLNTEELTSMDSDYESTDFDYLTDTDNTVWPTTTPRLGIEPHDEESIGKWYNIVLIDALTALIDDLNARGEVCLYIGQDGKAYVEDDGDDSVVHDFGEMPDMSLWKHIIEKLGEDDLFAEEQEGNRIFISWAS
jgi:hypothetical protein